MDIRPWHAAPVLSEWDSAFCEEQRVARLATIGPTGLPHLVPVCFALVDGAVATPIDEKPKRAGVLVRARNIAADPRATLLLDRYADDWTQLAWLRLDVRATVLPLGAAWPAALDRLRERYPQYRGMALESLPLLRLDVVRTASWCWPIDS